MTDSARVKTGSAAARDGGPPALDQAFDDGDSLYALRAAVAAHGSQAGLPEGRTRDLVPGRARTGRQTRSRTAPGRACGCGPPPRRCAARSPTARRRRPRHGRPGTDGPGAGSAEAADAALWHVEAGHGLWLVRRIADGASVQSDPSGTVAAVSFRLGAPGLRRVPAGSAGPCAAAPSWPSPASLDPGSSGEFGGAVGDLIAATPSLRLILDCTRLAWWDSSGLAALITAKQRISRDRSAG